MTQAGYSKQSTVQVLPPRAQLQTQCQQLWEIAAKLELPQEGNQIINRPQTLTQKMLQRRAKRIASARKQILAAAETLRSLSG